MIERLSHAAARFGASSGNQVAAEVIDLYLEFWVAAKEAQQAVLQQQRAALSAEKGAAKPPSKKKPSRRK